MLHLREKSFIFAPKDSYIICFMIDYSRIIKERRKLLKVTQEELSDATGVSLSFIKKIEQGKTNPSIGTLHVLVDALGMKIKIEPVDPYK